MKEVRYQGKITKWKDDQGFGFITPTGGGSPVFMHISALLRRSRRPEGDEIVTYEVVTDGENQVRAKNVLFLGERAPRKDAFVRDAASLMLAVLFLLFIAGSVSFYSLPLPIFVFYVGASIVAFLAYRFDKAAAKDDEWRTSENALHMLSLAGGWPGALIAQRLLRHKSKKQSFQVAFWSTVMLNCILLAVLFFLSGSPILKSFYKQNSSDPFSENQAFWQSQNQQPAVQVKSDKQGKGNAGKSYNPLSPPHIDASTGGEKIGSNKWLRNAIAFKESKDWKGALDWCLKWTKSEPERTEAWLHLGIAYDNLKRYNEAIEAYRQALRLNSENDTAWLKLGVAYSRSGNKSVALDIVKKLQSVDPQLADKLSRLIAPR